MRLVQVKSKKKKQVGKPADNTTTFCQSIFARLMSDSTLFIAKRQYEKRSISRLCSLGRFKDIIF